MTGKTQLAFMRSANFKVKIVPKMPIEQGIQAARGIFPRCWFDQGKCVDGINALRHYRYDVDEDSGQLSRKPLHDVYSHAADAFRYLAVSIKENQVQKKIRVIPFQMHDPAMGYMLAMCMLGQLFFEQGQF